jgi:hypothetical protein
MLIDGKTEGVWPGLLWLRAWRSPFCCWGRSLENLATWLTHSIFSLARSLARTLALQP